jgi:hypothetical protein
MTTAATDTALRLAPRLRGEMIVPGHPAYDGARAIDNRYHESRPAAVVRCAHPADVAATVRFAGLLPQRLFDALLRRRYHLPP